MRPFLKPNSSREEFDKFVDEAILEVTGMFTSKDFEDPDWECLYEARKTIRITKEDVCDYLADIDDTFYEHYYNAE